MLKRLFPILFVGLLLLFALAFVSNSGSHSSYNNLMATPLPTPTPKPTPKRQCPAGATALCRDGTCSYSANRRGTCSHHGGVAVWY